MISGFVNLTICILWIAYIFVGGYEAGKTAPLLRQADTVMRILKRSFGWPYYLYLEIKEESDNKWRL